MDLDGKSLAIILWSEKDEEDEASTHTRILRRIGGTYEFYRGEDNPKFMLEPEWIERIKEVPENLRQTLMDADYCLSLTVGPIPDDLDISDWVLTGLKIPEGD